MVHRLMMVAEEGFDALEDKVVHHKNHIPWDNRTENLELMSRAEHSSHHSEYWYDDEDLIADLRAGAEVLGRPPKRTDVANWGEYDPQVYANRWGNWIAALRAAGLDPGERFNK